jgi:hypothetical protein
VFSFFAFVAIKTNHESLILSLSTKQTEFGFATLHQPFTKVAWCRSSSRFYHNVHVPWSSHPQTISKPRTRTPSASRSVEWYKVNRSCLNGLIQGTKIYRKALIFPPKTQFYDVFLWTFSGTLRASHEASAWGPIKIRGRRAYTHSQSWDMSFTWLNWCWLSI